MPQIHNPSTSQCTDAFNKAEQITILINTGTCLEEASEWPDGDPDILEVRENRAVFIYL